MVFAKEAIGGQGGFGVVVVIHVVEVIKLVILEVDVEGVVTVVFFDERCHFEVISGLTLRKGDSKE